jgi:hypothetical protein
LAALVSRGLIVDNDVYRFEYILIALFLIARWPAEQSCKLPYRWAYISDIGNGFEADLKRKRSEFASAYWFPPYGRDRHSSFFSYPSAKIRNINISAKLFWKIRP